MKKYVFQFILVLYCIQYSYSQIDTTCAVKMGGNYYINCQHIIIFQGQDVFTVKKDIGGNTLLANFDLFSAQGKKEAEIKDGKVTMGNKNFYTINTSDKEYSFIEKSTGRIICLAKEIYDNKNKRCELDVWIDMCMPSGLCIEASPEEINLPFFSGMKGATFINSITAFTLE